MYAQKFAQCLTIEHSIVRRRRIPELLFHDLFRFNERFVELIPSDLKMRRAESFECQTSLFITFRCRIQCIIQIKNNGAYHGISLKLQTIFFVFTVQQFGHLLLIENQHVFSLIHSLDFRGKRKHIHYFRSFPNTVA